MGIGLNRVTAGGNKPQNPPVGFPLNELWGVVVWLIEFISVVAQREFDRGVTGLREWRDGEGEGFRCFFFAFSFFHFYLTLLYSPRITGLAGRSATVSYFVIPSHAPSTSITTTVNSRQIHHRGSQQKSQSKLQIGLVGHVNKITNTG